MSPGLRRLLLQRWLGAAAAGLLAPAAALANPAARAPTPADPVRRGRELRFPRDHGAHPGSRIEWWYATGWLGPAQAPLQGVQLTFFRSATGLAADLDGRFAPRQLLFAHAAVVDLQRGEHRHDQRLARWNGRADAPLAAASTEDGAVHVGPWWLRREGPVWHAHLPAQGFDLEMAMTRTQAVLLQGDRGFSRKGPQEQQASHYYSEPQLALQARVRWHAGAGSEPAPRLAAARTAAAPAAGLAAGPGIAQGRAWLDHEWSDELMHPQAVGWDWIGMQGLDGSALTVFVLRRADGTALWRGGSWRPAALAGRVGEAQAARSFAPDEVQMQPGRRWRSPASGASYPVEWQVRCPAGEFTVRALLDAQELDSRQSTGTVYWEGLSALEDASGRRVGLGYLEMTGYVTPLRLG